MSEREIFIEALRQEEPAARTAYLDRACAGDASLRRRVEILLRAHSRASRFLERPAAEQLAGVSAFDPTRAESRDPEDATLEFLQPSTRPDSLGRLGHYEILNVVGRGGFGIVLRAFDEKLHRVVAIKVMAAELAASSTARKRFIREARAAAAVAHEHVVTIHAVEEQHQPPYLVMQFIEGISLQEKLDQAGPLDLKEILRIGLQVAEGLAAAHKQGLVHRDIKPANILLENGVERVKLTDFGLARAVDDASVTQSGVIAGTPQFMSPEQAQGLPVDHRSDLFSLGSVLYALCTGRPPFRADGTIAVLRRVAEDTPRLVREVTPDIPEWLSTLIHRLLAKDPAQRYASATEVAQVLAGHLAELQYVTTKRVIPAPPAAPVPARRPAQTLLHLSPRGWAVAACVLGVWALLISTTEAIGVTEIAKTIIHVFRPQGSLRVEVLDPTVSVSIEGQDVVVTGAGAKEIRLKPGEYSLTTRRGDTVIQQESVTIERNGQVLVQVAPEPAPVPSQRTNAANLPLDVLDPLVRIAEQKYDRVRELAKRGSVSRGEVIDSQIELIEARLRRAAEQARIAERDKLFADLVAAHQEHLKLVLKQHEAGVVPTATVEQAQKAVLEAQLRWKQQRVDPSIQAPAKARDGPVGAPQ